MLEVGVHLRFSLRLMALHLFDFKTMKVKNMQDLRKGL
jgi:hypothetical protein